jgi:L-lysine 2,3-aminomutase
MIQRYSNGDKKIYLMLHINHSRELTRQSRQALKILRQSGAALVNQTPMIRGVNDNPQVLADLFLQLNMLDVPPYYIFQCRPTLGNKTFAVPIAEGWNILEQAKDRVSGLGRRARLVMSHKTGKIEILAVTPEHTVMKYHRNADPANRSKVMIYKTNPEAFWLDDFEEYKAWLKQEGLEGDTDPYTYW